MNEQMQSWLTCFIDTGNGVSCVSEHYPDVKEQYRSSKAAQLKRKLSNEIISGTRQVIAANAPTMLNVLKQIALNQLEEDVRPSERLKAASEWLSRSGLDSAIVIETQTATHSQLLERLKIATQGIDPSLLANALPENLLAQLKDKDHEETKH